MEGGNSSNNNKSLVPPKMYPSRLSKPTASSTNFGADVGASGSASPLPRTRPGRPPLHPSTPAKAAAQSQYRSGQNYHYMPINNVIRMMRRALPANIKITDEAKETVQECVSEFISFVTEEAREKCHNEKRIVITGDDLISAMAELGFDDYVGPLQRYLQKYRQSEGRDQPLFPMVRLLRPTAVGPAVMMPLPMGPYNPAHHAAGVGFGMSGGPSSYTTTVATTTPANNTGGVGFGTGGSGVGADTTVIATPANIGGAGFVIGGSGVGANTTTVVATPENIGGASVDHGFDASNNSGNDNLLGYDALFDVGSSSSMDNMFDFEELFTGGAQELDPFYPLA